LDVGTLELIENLDGYELKKDRQHNHIGRPDGVHPAFPSHAQP